MKPESIYIGVSEVLQFAIRIEENGEKFYRKAAGMNAGEKMKELFTFLADEEVKHRETFEAMLPAVEKYEPTDAYPPEYFTYLRAYADNIVFKTGTEEELNAAKEPLAALDFGIQRELDSITYYHETINFVPENQHSVINAVIDEERRHFVQLSQMKKELQEGG